MCKLCRRFIACLALVGVILATTCANPQCDGTASVTVVYEDTQIRRVVWNGVNQVSSFAVGTPFTATRLSLETDKESYAGENGIAGYPANNFWFPAGTRGPNSLYMFGTDTLQWSDIDVYCKPVGVHAFGYDIVGFCEVNSSPTPCLPYFKVQLRGGQWTDISGRGLCSYSLASTNLTNPVILSYPSQYGYSVELYVAEQETGILHVLDLSNPQSECYNIPRVGDHALKIIRIVPAVAKDGSFAGIRIELSVESSGSVHHVLFSSGRFTQTSIQTETIVYDSYNLNYFVSFAANLRTMIVSFRNGTRQYTLPVTLDDPVRCENLVGPNSHYLVCLADNGLIPLLINIANGTSQTIPIRDSPVTKLGTLNENMFYLVNSHQKLSLYVVNSSSIVHIGTYTVRSNSNFKLMDFTSNISCSVDVANESNNIDLINQTDEPNNQTITTNHTSDEPGDMPTNTPINETGPTNATVTTGITDSTNVSTDKPKETNVTSHPSNTDDTSEANNTEADGPDSNKQTEDSDNSNNKTGEWIVICILGIVVVVLVVPIIVILVVMIRQLTSKHHKLILSQRVTAEDGTRSQKDIDKLIPNPVGKQQPTPDDIPESKPTSFVKSLSFTGGSCGDNRSEHFVPFVEANSIKSPHPCSDENSSPAPSPDLRFSPDGTDLNP